MTENLFQSDQLKESIRFGLEKIKFVHPTSVQQKIIPRLLNHESVIVQAVTGSGKTHAYLIPIMDRLTDDKTTQAVITVPSRELADQLYHVLRTLRDAAGMSIRLACLVGGSDRQRQEHKAQVTVPQIVIATPGRLTDFVTKKVVNLEHVEFFVVDEADMTLDMGFLPQIEQVMQRLPEGVAIDAFSATIPAQLTQLLMRNAKHAEQIIIDPKITLAPEIENDLIDIGAKSRQEILYQLLTMGQPYLALVFANTKKRVDELTQYLQSKDLKVAKIHAGLTERERKRVLRQVREGQFQYVVASDLASRGLDLPNVSLVINYELPQDLTFVIHRIGRTGRQNRFGQAITLITEEEMTQITQLEAMGVSFQFKEIKNGELKSRSHYRRREHRQKNGAKLTGQLASLVQKEKSSHKPGYKRKLKQKIQAHEQQVQKLSARHHHRQKQRQHKRDQDTFR